MAKRPISPSAPPPDKNREIETFLNNMGLDKFPEFREAVTGPEALGGVSAADLHYFNQSFQNALNKNTIHLDPDKPRPYNIHFANTANSTLNVTSSGVPTDKIRQTFRNIADHTQKTPALLHDKSSPGYRAILTDEAIEIGQGTFGRFGGWGSEGYAGVAEKKANKRFEVSFTAATIHLDKSAEEKHATPVPSPKSEPAPPAPADKKTVKRANFGYRRLKRENAQGAITNVLAQGNAAVAPVTNANAYAKQTLANPSNVADTGDGPVMISPGVVATDGEIMEANKRARKGQDPRSLLAGIHAQNTRLAPSN